MGQVNSGDRVLYRFTGNEVAPPVDHYGVIIALNCGYPGCSSDGMVLVAWESGGRTPIHERHLEVIG